MGYRKEGGSTVRAVQGVFSRLHFRLKVALYSGILCSRTGFVPEHPVGTVILSTSTDMLPRKIGQ